MKSREVLESVRAEVASLNSTSYSHLSVESLQAGLTIISQKDTDIIQLSFESLEPKLAADVINSLMAIYLKKNLIYSRSKSTATRVFISRQLPKVRQQVFLADTNLKKFKEKYGISDLESSKTGIAASQLKIKDQLETLDTQLAELSEQDSRIRQELGINDGQALALSSVSQS